MLRPSNNSTPFSKKLRHRYHYQQQRIEISAIACQHFLWNRISRLGAAVGCFLVVCLVGSWPFLSRPRDTMPSVDLVEIRVFGPTIQGNTHRALPESNQEMSFQQFSTTEQRDFLLKYGRICQSWTASDQNLLLNRFDSFQSSPYLQIELWKYCMLYIGVGNFYYDANEAVMMYDWNEVVDKIKRKRFAAIALKIGTVVDGVSGSRQRFHESLMYLSNPKSPVALSMIKVLVETPQSVLDSQDTLPISLALAMEKELADAAAAWQLWWVSCRDLAPEVAFTQHFDRNVLRSRCPAPGEYCCQVTFDQNRDNPPILALRHPSRVNNPFQLDEPKVPHLVVDRHVEQHELVQSDRADDLPYISAVRLVDLKVTPVSILETPNFFDILVQNDCLPTQKECHHCLQRNGNCMACQEECACYCQVLCRIRPPPKRVAQELVVRPPIFRKDPARLVPRIVHQTWYEAVTPNKYPNMSRLIQSWSTSGWEYRFYDDATAAEFLSQHFPPHVREAYDALIPGAFKADLFRYCVLLIYGGVYADMDVLLESNLDHAVAPDVGFMTPIDEVGFNWCDILALSSLTFAKFSVPPAYLSGSPEVMLVIAAACGMGSWQWHQGIPSWPRLSNLSSTTSEIGSRLSIMTTCFVPIQC